MRIPRIYLETSVFNFVFADDAPDKKADTIKLFEEIGQGKYQPFTSAYVYDELSKAQEEKRNKMYALINGYGVNALPATQEIERLAKIYVQEGIIPQKYDADALHIAAASVNELDIIVSWNFKHIVKLKTITQTEIVNLKEGYKRIHINSPSEVIEND
jgi:rRNA-processing protein FCF1